MTVNEYSSRATSLTQILFLPTGYLLLVYYQEESMSKFAIALAAFVSLGLAVPAFAQEKKDTMPAEKMVVHHHHHHHHHHMMKPEPKPQ
jgi:hypothetical protein